MSTDRVTVAVELVERGFSRFLVLTPIGPRAADPDVVAEVRKAGWHIMRGLGLAPVPRPPGPPRDQPDQRRRGEK